MFERSDRSQAFVYDIIIKYLEKECSCLCLARLGQEKVYACAKCSERAANQCHVFQVL